MLIRQFGQRCRVIPALLAGAILLLAGHTAHAHMVPLSDVLRGIRMTQAQCSALPLTVWVTVSNQSFCIRYYLSNAGGEGSRPVVFLQGDKLGKLDFKTGAFSLRPHDKDLDTDDLVKWADGLSKQTKTTGIYLARVGLDGSSGDHRIRHSVLELTAMHAALDAIKQRHRFDGFHLVGQSGGAQIVGGLLALRSDIGCAVIGAGKLVSPVKRAAPADPGRTWYNVADGIRTIAQRRSTRILLVTDPADKKVSVETQSPFVPMLRQAGGQADQFIVQATDDDRHGVTGYSRAAAADCIRGASTQEIAQNLSALVEKRLAAKAKADAKAADAKAQTAPQPAAAPASSAAGSRS